LLKGQKLKPIIGLNNSKKSQNLNLNFSNRGIPSKIEENHWKSIKIIRIRLNAWNNV